MSKGSRVRPHNKKAFDAEYERIFGKKRLNVWNDSPPKEEPNYGIQGNAGDGAPDSADRGRANSVPQEPGASLDPAPSSAVGTPQEGTCQSGEVCIARALGERECRNCGEPDCPSAPGSADAI